MSNANPEYRNMVHRLMAFIGTVLLFAPSLATVITILFFGFRTLIHGGQTCQILFQQNAWNLILYTSCGCAIVEIVLLIISIITIRFSAPQLLKHLLFVRNQKKKGC